MGLKLLLGWCLGVVVSLKFKEFNGFAISLRWCLGFAGFLIWVELFPGLLGVEFG